MDIFGIGPSELILILVVALIFLGPKDLAKTGRSIGRFLRKLILSEEWHAIQQAGKELRNMPNRLIREAGIEEMEQNLHIDLRGQQPNNSIKIETDQKDLSAWTTPPPTIESPDSTQSSAESDSPDSQSDLDQS